MEISLDYSNKLNRVLQDNLCRLGYARMSHLWDPQTFLSSMFHPVLSSLLRLDQYILLSFGVASYPLSATIYHLPCTSCFAGCKTFRFWRSLELLPSLDFKEVESI